MNNVTHLRRMQTPAQILEDASGARLKHVVVVGITEDGENYFECDGQQSLKDLVWMYFCAHDSIQSLVHRRDE